MTSYRPLILLALLIILTQPAAAQEALWGQVLEKMTGDSGYSLQLDYSGPEGLFHFRYTVHGDGERIFTEVLEGSSRGVGTKIYYDPEKDAENVAMQTRFMRLRRSLTARDIKDSPLYLPLFRHLLGQLQQPEPTEIATLEDETMVFTFGDKTSDYDCLEVDSLGNPVTLRRVEDGKEVNTLTFRQLEWGEKPIAWED